MSSVRPKLSADTPKSITAWETTTGRVVWMTADGGWSYEATQLATFTGDEAETRLEQAKAEEGKITDPYFMEVSDTGAIAGRETLRETIRATGPTVSYGDSQ